MNSTDLFSTLAHRFGRLYSKLMPIPCLLCGAASGSECLCHACSEQLPKLGPACPRCASPLPQEMLCGHCLNNPPEQDSSFSLYRYDEPINRLIADLKYHDKLVLSRYFADQMAKALLGHPLPKLLIPIPLHPRRLRERGYNQSLEIAKYLSKQLNIPVRNDILLRVKDTPPQASLPFNERKQNIKEAFQIHKMDISSHVALIDDVLTTGHTVNVAAKKLRQAGIKTIDVWTLARTIRNSHSN